MSIRTSSFLRGLSSFWNRLFADRDVINEAYLGSEETFGQAYLDLMEAVLAISLNNVPLFRRENWKLITLREDQLVYDPSGSVQFTYNLEEVADLKYLYNQILSPTVFLEKGFNFDVVTTDNYNQTDRTYKLGLYTNPFTSGTGGGIIDGVASRQLTLTSPTIHINDVIDGRLGVDPGEVTSTTTSFFSPQANTTSGYKFSSIDLGRNLVIKYSTGEVTYQVLTIVADDHVLLQTASGETPSFTFTTGLSWRLESSVVRELSFWSPNVDIDWRTLQENFGYLVNRFEPTTESYKILIKGIFFYFLLGPSLQRVESALNVISDLPVAAADEELLTGYTAAYTPTHDRITTNLGTYEIPVGAVRADVADPASLNVLTFDAFEAFSNVFTVKDYVSHPTWWYEIVVPADLMPGESFDRRTIYPSLFDFLYGDPDTEALYGDLGIAFGADDDGTLVPSGASRPGLHHNHAYHAMDKFIKHHMFGVFIDPNFALPRAKEDLIDIIDAGKPSYTFAYFQPTVDYTEAVTVDDVLFQLDVNIGGTSGAGGGGGALTDSIPRLPNLLTVGSPLVIPSYFVYAGSGAITITAGTADPTLGETQAVIGGEDPMTFSGGGLGNNLCDWPAQLTLV